MSHSLQPHGLHHTGLLCPPLSPGVCSNSCSLSRWCHPTISSSAASFSSSLQSFPASGSFSTSQLFTPDGHKVLELQLQHQSFHWIIRVDFLYNWLVWPPCSPRNPQESSTAWHFKSINSSVLSFLYGPHLTPIQDYWKSHDFDVYCHSNDDQSLSIQLGVAPTSRWWAQSYFFSGCWYFTLISPPDYNILCLNIIWNCLTWWTRVFWLRTCFFLTWLITSHFKSGGWGRWISLCLAILCTYPHAKNSLHTSEGHRKCSITFAKPLNQNFMMPMSLLSLQSGDFYEIHFF